MDGRVPDRLNAARAWSMTSTLDSAYFHLFKIAEQEDNDNPKAPNAYRYFWEALHTDHYFQFMRLDARWPDLCGRAKAYLPSMPELAKILEEVLKQDESIARKQIR